MTPVTAWHFAGGTPSTEKLWIPRYRDERKPAISGLPPMSSDQLSES